MELVLVSATAHYLSVLPWIALEEQCYSMQRRTVVTIKSLVV